MVVMPSYDELLHQLRALRAENGELRAALSNEAEPFERDDKDADQRASRFWFASWKEAKRQNRVLRDEVARQDALLKAGGRGA
jgi:hypothetical protein